MEVVWLDWKTKRLSNYFELLKRARKTIFVRQLINEADCIVNQLLEMQWQLLIDLDTLYCKTIFIPFLNRKNLTIILHKSYNENMTIFSLFRAYSDLQHTTTPTLF